MMNFQAKTNNGRIYNFEIVNNKIWCLEIRTQDGFDQIELSADFRLERSGQKGYVYLSEHLYSNGMPEDYVVEWIIAADTYEYLFRANSPIKVSKLTRITEKRNDDGSYSIQLPKRYTLKAIMSISEENPNQEYIFIVEGNSITMRNTTIKGANCLQINNGGFVMYDTKRGPIISSPQEAEIIAWTTDIQPQELDELMQAGILVISGPVIKNYFSTSPVVGPNLVHAREIN